MREQRECNLTVRFTWEVARGQSHPEHTYTCAEDADMAAQMALNATIATTRGIRFAGVDVSPDGGRHIPWQRIDLDEYLAVKLRTAAASTTPQAAASAR